MSDWSSDVCSSDLFGDIGGDGGRVRAALFPPECAARVRDHHRAIIVGSVDPLSDRAALEARPVRDHRDCGDDDRLQLSGDALSRLRSEERRVGKESVSTCSARWSTYNNKKK